MKKIVLFVVLSLLVGCGTTQVPYKTISGFAQGTIYNITYQDSVDYKADIDAFLSDFDSSLSFYNDSSLLNCLNRGEEVVVDSLFKEAFDATRAVNELSDGFFDPTVGSLFRAYGFVGGGRPTMLSDSQIDSAMVAVGFSKLTISGDTLYRENCGVMLDFSGIAQGQSADMVAALLESKGVRNYMVEIGGEILLRGVSSRGGAWRIGIDTPEQGNMVSGESISKIVEVGGVDKARGLATSGNYRKYIDTDSHERITHTLDPLTGHPAHHSLLSATILAPTAAFADGFATAAMVGGVDWARDKVDSLQSVGFDIDCFLIYADSTSSKMLTYSTL